MNTQFNTFAKSLLVLGVFSITALITYGVMNTSERVFKSTPYQTRNATADADLNRLTNGVGAGILDGVIAKVKARATEKGGNPLNVKKYNAYIDTYLAGVDRLDNETRETLGSDYDFIFKYIYPRVYELRQVDNTPSSLFGKLGDMVNLSDSGSSPVNSEVRSTGSINTGAINTTPDSFTMYQDGKLIPKRDTFPFYILDKSKGTVTYKWNVKNVEGCRMTSGYKVNGMGMGPTSNDLDTDKYWMPATGEKVMPLSMSESELGMGQGTTQGFIYYTQLRCGPKSKRWTEYSVVSPLDLNFIEVRDDVSSSSTSTSSSTSNTTGAQTQTSTTAQQQATTAAQAAKLAADTTLSFTLASGPIFKEGDTVTVNYRIGTAYSACGFMETNNLGMFSSSSNSVYNAGTPEPQQVGVGTYSFTATKGMKSIYFTCVGARGVSGKSDKSFLIGCSDPEAYYMANNPDVNQAFESNPSWKTFDASGKSTSGYTHYWDRTGKTEGRPSCW